jgi:hypothetical protein
MTMKSDSVILSLCVLTGALMAQERPALSLSFDDVRGDLCADQADAAAAKILRGDAGSPVRVPGMRGGALWFWGEPGQGVCVADRAGLALTGKMTISAWIWVQRFGDHQTIVWKGDRKPVIDAVNFRLALRPEGKLEFSFKGPADEWYQIMSPSPVLLHQWIHVAASFDNGMCALMVAGKRVAEGRLNTFGGPAGKTAWSGDRMLTNGAPVEIGVGQGPSGEPSQFFCGAIDEVCVWPAALNKVPEASVPQEQTPLRSLVLAEKTFTAAEILRAPYLVGRVGNGHVPWIMEVGFSGQAEWSVRVCGENGADGTFRYLFDDFCGPHDLRGATQVKVRICRTGDAPQNVAAEVSLEAAPNMAHVGVSPDKPLQQMRGFGCYADLPETFYDDPQMRETQYAPLLAELREAGVTHLDFSTPAAPLEPQNDDADPLHISWAPFRDRFKSNAKMRTLSKYLAYVQSQGFTVGLRVLGYADWQWVGQGAGRIPDSAEVAEFCVALLSLLKEDGVALTHIVPVWEPPYPPETVADICAQTSRLAKQHGFDLPVVGPYRIATGGQGMNMDTMPDQYLNGKRYVEAYLKAMGDSGAVIGVEDYAAGCAMTEPNLKRLWREVIEPMSKAAAPRELWMLEYGPICSQVGPWNFYPSRWHGGYTGYESAFRLALMVHQQLNGGVSKFFYWKAYDVAGDGKLISSCGLVKSAQHDGERRPPYQAARVLWKHVPLGARHLACVADGGVLANAFAKDGRFTVLLANPRSVSVPAEIQIEKTDLAPQAYLYTSTEKVAYQECELNPAGRGLASVLLPPRSVNALVCRAAHVAVPFERTVWPDPSAACVYLSDLQWAAVSVAGKPGFEHAAINGMGVTVHQDETPAFDWLTLGGVRYRKGLGTRAPSEVIYELDGGYASFEALAGIDDAAQVPATYAGAVFTVSVDGKAVFKSEPVKPGQKGVKVSVPCAGAKELRLTVSCDKSVFADWAEARLAR